jgi:hypothetical protein
LQVQLAAQSLPHHLYSLRCHIKMEWPWHLFHKNQRWSSIAGNVGVFDGRYFSHEDTTQHLAAIQICAFNVLFICVSKHFLPCFEASKNLLEQPLLTDFRKARDYWWQGSVTSDLKPRDLFKNNYSFSVCQRPLTKSPRFAQNVIGLLCLVFPNVCSASFETSRKPQNAFISKTHFFPSLVWTLQKIGTY